MKWGVKKESALSKDSGENKDKRFDVLFALCRRIEQRMILLESDLSTIRRDLNATRRKVYRETPHNEEAEVKTVDLIPNNGRLSEEGLYALRR